MTNDDPPPISNSDGKNKKSQQNDNLLESEKTKYEEYEDNERTNWKNFWDELEKERNNLAIHNTELGKLLKMNARDVPAFLQAKKGAKVHFPCKYHIMMIWDYLTNPQRKLSRISLELSEEKVKANCQRLRTEGPNRWLKLAGFLPDNNEILKSQNYNCRVHRIASRLSSNWISAEKFWQLEEAILNEIQESHLPTKENVIDITKAKDWLRQIVTSDTEGIGKKFDSSLERYAYLGKSEFNEIELFELYQSILENSWFKEKRQLSSIRIVNVEFENLTKSLDFLKEKNRDVFDRINEKGTKYEWEIIKSKIPNSKTSIEISTLIPLTKATITCRLGKEEDKATKLSSFVRWQYSSTSPHVETMLEALHHGLGYPSLKLSGLSVRSLGKKANSLARVSVSLTDESPEHKIYYGLWVDQNTLTAILQAVVVAVNDWLFNTVTNGANYQEICKNLAQILENLSEARKALNDYNLHSPEQEKQDINRGANEYLNEAIKNIKDIKEKLKKENSDFQKCYTDKLERHQQMAKLMLSRSAHIEGDMDEAGTNLKELYNEGINNQAPPISILYAAEEIIHKFFSGDKEFILKKQWRNEELTIDSHLKEIQDYIINTKDNLFFDFHLYLCISEIHGNFGRLELYFCKEIEDRKYIEQAIDNFLVAAYFSSKIGNMQRVSHWLTHVSRAYSRLGGSKAKNYARKYVILAEEIVIQLISPKYSLKECAWRQAECHLAKGEYYFHFEQNKEDLKKSNTASIKNFLSALKGAMVLSFCRLIADSLYGTYRILKKIDDGKEEFSITNEEFKKTLTDINKFYAQYHPNAKQNKESIADNISKRLSEIINDIPSNSSELNLWNLGAISIKFKEGAKYVWHTLANQRKENDDNQYSIEVEHPIEVEIEEDSFLAKLG